MSKTDPTEQLFDSIRELRQNAIEYFRETRCESALGIDSRTANRCANALMLFDDLLLALEHAVSTSEKIGDFGEYYFRVFGWLQILFVQQDTIVQIETDLGIRRPFTASELDLRAVRNMTTGHPAFASRYGGTHGLIARNTVPSRIFAVVSGPPHAGGAIDRNLLKLSADHLSSIQNRLETIWCEMKKRDQAYRDRFAATDLHEITKGTEYLAQKVLEATISGEKWLNIGLCHAEMLGNALAGIENGLAGRADAASFSDLIAICRHALARVEGIARVDLDDISLNRDAYILAGFLHQSVSSLARECRALEEKYKPRAA